MRAAGAASLSAAWWSACEPIAASVAPEGPWRPARPPAPGRRGVGAWVVLPALTLDADRLEPGSRVRAQRPWPGSGSRRRPSTAGTTDIREHGPDGLEDRSPRPGRVWNRIPDPVRERLLALALEVPELSSRELAIRFTDHGEVFCLRGFGLPVAEGA